MAMAYLLVGVVVYFLGIVDGVWSTPLDDYVHKPDPHYNYRYISKLKGPNYMVYILNMTSQEWLNENVTKNPIWWHYLNIVVPKKIIYNDTALIWIDGGSNTDRVPTMVDKFLPLITAMAVRTGSVAATIKQIPNQPIEFLRDPSHRRRKEDAVIAWTWREFLDNGTNPEILLRLPMTKAVVRGMDTVSTFIRKLTDNNIDKFVVGGASKRGWTTWTVAAVDKRVVGMVPIVMDLLNLQRTLHHHYKSLGGWTFAFDDYYYLNITQDLDTLNMKRLMAVVDPLTYRQRYTIPKLIMTAAGDEFFLPDDSHYYFDQLQAPKFLRLVPNAEHSMLGHIISDILTFESFYLNILEKSPFPTLSWENSQTARGGKIRVRMSREPLSVKVFKAWTLDAKRRDFRLFIKDPETGDKIFHPVFWSSREAKKLNTLEYEAEEDKPLEGWAAFFIQVSFAGVKNTILEFTTELNIVPNTFPFQDCSGPSCHGTLV